jgi:hypothetical protein
MLPSPPLPPLCAECRRPIARDEAASWLDCGCYAHTDCWVRRTQLCAEARLSSIKCARCYGCVAVSAACGMLGAKRPRAMCGESARETNDC